jgi:hypothetical protein
MSIAAMKRFAAGKTEAEKPPPGITYNLMKQFRIICNCIARAELPSQRGRGIAF